MGHSKLSNFVEKIMLDFYMQLQVLRCAIMDKEEISHPILGVRQLMLILLTDMENGLGSTMLSFTSTMFMEVER